MVFVLLFAWRVLSFISASNGTMIRDIWYYPASTDASCAPLLPRQWQRAGKRDDPQLGSDKAAVTIVEFADFGCPYSRAEFVVRALAERFPMMLDHPPDFLSNLHLVLKSRRRWECVPKLRVNFGIS